MGSGNLITHIEVRSVLTAQGKGGIPAGFTINPYRGCLFGCSYCLAPDTRVRYADLSEKPLGDVRPGDVLLGFDEHPAPYKHQRYRHSVVENVWWSKKLAFRIVTEGAEVITTADHLWLSGTRVPVWTSAGQLTTRHSLRHIPLDEQLITAPARIQHIEPVGMMDVVDIQTSTRTFIANGLATHNCYASKFVFDDAGKKADWGYWVEVKQNAVDALQRESHKITGKSVFVGSATDPYQPVELRIGLTRALLETLLLAFPARVHIQTRSPHVVRDIDIFRKFGDALTVGISVPTDSEVVRKAFEPRAPSIPRRLAAGKQLREAGIRVSASVAPLLPCTPTRLAKLLAPNFDYAWVGSLNFYDKADPLRQIYASRHWEPYLHPTHAANVRTALAAAMELH